MNTMNTKTKECRNIIDFYAYWKNEAIKADLDRKRHPFAVLCCNIGGDYNLATVVRCANAFLAERVYIYGRRRWDKRGAVGTYHYEHITYLTEDSDLGELDPYTWIGVDNVEGAIPIDEFSWPDKPLLCFGEEQLGLAPAIKEKCKHLIYIRQYGSVRSLNVGVAAGIAMQDWVVKNA